METLPPRPASIRTLTNEESSRLDRREKRRFSREECPTCSGAKIFRWYKDDLREQITDWECSCFDQLVMYRFLANAGIGLNYQRLGWSDLLGVSTDVIEKILEYLEDPEPWLRMGQGWFMYGDMGTGKTLVATLMLKNLLSRGHDGYFTTFIEMLDNFRSTWNSEEERRWFYRRVKNAGILVIDDPGREHVHTTTSEPMLDEVIRHRVSSCLPTFITTNHDIERFELAYGSNIASLLSESTTIMEMKGRDYRGEFERRKREEGTLRLQRPIVLG